VSTRREFLKKTGYGAAVAGVSALAGAESVWGGASPKSKLNFVLILIDDLGWMDLACQGSSFYQTPHIDELASQGMRFTDAYASCPVCSPTRASIMTGKYPARLKLTNWHPTRNPVPNPKLITPTFELRLADSEITIAQALKPHGYICASIGKWHLGDKPYLPENKGFDLNFGGNAAGSPRSYFYPEWGDMPPIKAANGTYLTDVLTDRALAFIEENRDKPFFLYLSHYAVHIPFEAKKPVIDKYAGNVVAGLRPGLSTHVVAGSHPEPVEGRPGLGSGQKNATYAAMVESVDDSVGRVISKLDDLGIADRTVVIFTSDNGGLSVPDGGFPAATSNAPLRAGKGYTYEGGVRVPLIVRWPGVVKPGAISPAQVCSIDFYPTVLEAAGPKGSPKHKVDGINVIPALQGSKSLERDALYWHYPHYSNQKGTPSGAVRSGDYKLIRFYEDSHEELYNLAEDASESRDLRSKMPDTASELSKKIDAWLKETHADMPTRNPDYEPEVTEAYE